MHDPRVGRFLSLDPLQKSFPWNSPYSFSENRVIDAVELEGGEILPSQYYTFAKIGVYGETVQKSVYGIEDGLENMATLNFWKNLGTNFLDDTTKIISRDYAGLATKTSETAVQLAFLYSGDDTRRKAQVTTEIIGTVLVTRGVSKLIKIAPELNFPKTKVSKIPLENSTPISSLKLSISKSLEGSTINYDVANTEIGIGEATLNKGVLELDFHVPEALQGKGLGTKMFNDAIKTFGNKIEKVQGLWLEGANLDAFNKAIKGGLKPKEAVFETPTGSWAKANGFNKIEWGSASDFNTNGTANRVQVYFKKE